MAIIKVIPSNPPAVSFTAGNWPYSIINLLTDGDDWWIDITFSAANIVGNADSYAGFHAMIARAQGGFYIVDGAFKWFTSADVELLSVPLTWSVSQTVRFRFQRSGSTRKVIITGATTGDGEYTHTNTSLYLSNSPVSFGDVEGSPGFTILGSISNVFGPDPAIQISSTHTMNPVEVSASFSVTNSSAASISAAISMGEIQISSSMVVGSLPAATIVASIQIGESDTQSSASVSQGTSLALQGVSKNRRGSAFGPATGTLTTPAVATGVGAFVAYVARGAWDLVAQPTPVDSTSRTWSILAGGPHAYPVFPTAKVGVYFSTGPGSGVHTLSANWDHESNDVNKGSEQTQALISIGNGSVTPVLRSSTRVFRSAAATHVSASETFTAPGVLLVLIFGEGGLGRTHQFDPLTPGAVRIPGASYEDDPSTSEFVSGYIQTEAIILPVPGPGSYSVSVASQFIGGSYEAAQIVTVAIQEAEGRTIDAGIVLDPVLVSASLAVSNPALISANVTLDPPSLDAIFQVTNQPAATIVASIQIGEVLQSSSIAVAVSMTSVSQMDPASVFCEMTAQASVVITMQMLSDIGGVSVISQIESAAVRRTWENYKTTRSDAMPSYFVSGDLEPDLLLRLVEVKNNIVTPVDMTGALSVSMRWRKPGGSVSTVSLIVDSPSSGMVRKVWGPGDTDLTGTHEAQVVITWGNGENQTIPSDSTFFRWIVSARIS